MLKAICIFTIIIITIFYLSSCKYNIKSHNKEYVGNKINKLSVIDAFIYFQESLMLSIRLFRMNKFVDYFLIIISNTTFTGLPLQISFSPFESFVEQYRNKIVFYNISHPSYCKKTWCREKYQRDVISIAVKSLNPSNNSLVIVSDLDEIPTTHAMNYIIKNPPKEFYMLSGYMYYYNYRHKFKEGSSGVAVMKLSNCKNIQIYRDKRNEFLKTNAIPIYPSITHCSFCYTNISFIQKKLNSFSHSEYNKPPYTNTEYIKKCIKSHYNFALKYKFDVVEYDKDLNPLPNDSRFDFLKVEYGIY